MPHPKKFSTVFKTYVGDGRPLGQGGAGIVYAVRDEAGEEFAVKVYRPKVPTSESLKRFRNEIAFLTALDHPNVVPALGSGLVNDDGEDRPFFVMPLFPKTLRTLMDQTGGIPPEKVLPLFDQMLSGVQALHLGKIFHRDLKPQNVLYSPLEGRLVIGDLGIADGPEDLQATTVETGPAARLAGLYAAPEQLQPRPTADERSDIFALGLVLSEMFTGEVPRGQDPKGIAAPDFTYLNELVRAMTQQSPEKRPQSIREIKSELLRRGNAFVLQQRLSELEKRVVPAGSPENPYAANPVELISARYTEAGLLELTLNRAVTPEWLQVLQTAPLGYSMGYPPSSFTFAGKTATVQPGYPSQSQHLIDHFKSWLSQMPLLFQRHVEEQAAKREREERGRLELARRQAEETKRINEGLRI